MGHFVITSPCSIKHGGKLTHQFGVTALHWKVFDYKLALTLIVTEYHQCDCTINITPTANHRRRK